MMKKRWMTVVLAFVMMFCVTGFAACGGDGGDEDTADVKVVKLWLHKSEAEPEGIVYRTIADNFNALGLKTQDGRTIRVKLDFKNSAKALADSITSEILGGGLPDVFAVDSPNITAYAAENVIIPIDEYITTEEKDSYVNSVITQSTYKNKLYALSGMDSPAGLYYNKEVLKQVGYTDADFGTIAAPWSWKDVEEAMDKIIAKNKELKQEGKKELPYKIKLNIGFGGDEGSMYLYSPLVYSAGGSFADANEKVTGSLNSEKSLAGISMLTEIFEQDATKSWVYRGSNVNAFPGGEVAFEIYGSWLIDAIDKDYRTFKDKYDIMPFPVYEDADGNKGEVKSPCGSWGFSVTEAAKDEYAASRVVAYFTGAESSRLMYESIGTFPTHKSLLADTDLFGSGAAKSLSDLLVNTSAPRPLLAKYPKVSDAYKEIINYVQTKAGKSDYNLEKYALEKAQGADSGK